MKKRILIVLAVIALFSLTLLASCQEPCQHDYAPNHDGENHWQECKLCGDKKDVAPHDLKWVTTDAEQHWQTCSCGYVSTSRTDHEDVKNNQTNALTPDGKCDVCERDLHEHSYEWKSDPTKHWQECSCSDKIIPEQPNHVDVKNNDNPEQATPDGKCDVCGREIYVVTFNMQDHGQAVDAQKVAKGGVATAPQAPANDGLWEFKGWYKEAECQNAFVFANEEINADTTVYAKWEEDTTPGASKDYAHILTLEQEILKPIAKDAVVYFVYTATEAGRYTVSLGSGINSQKCTFTVDVAQGTFDEDNSYVNFDLEEGGKVYVELTCAVQLDEDATAGVLIETCKGGDPLPEEYFLDGEYADDNEYYTVIIDREAGKVTYNQQECDFQYIGGNIKTLTFRWSGEFMSSSCSLTYNEDGTYTFVSKSQYDEETVTLNYVVLPDPVAVDKVLGYYEPESESGAYNGITKLWIYAGEADKQVVVRYVDSYGYSDLLDTELSAKNIISFSGFKVTLNLAEDGAVTNINLGTSSEDGKVYIKKSAPGDIPPKRLPLNCIEYVGEKESIVVVGGEFQNWSSGYTVKVIDFNKDSGVYTVMNDDTEYKLVLEDNSIKLYEADGTTLYDTLVGFVPVFHNAPASGVEQSIAKADFAKNYYWYNVAQTGWYTLTASGDGTVVYYNVDKSNPADSHNSWDAKQAGEDPVKLLANTAIAIYVGNCDEVPASVTFTLTEAQAPAGMSEQNPILIVDGKAVIAKMDSESEYYFKYEGLKAGVYVVGCTYEGYYGASTIHFKINNKDYGYNVELSEYYGDMTVSFPYAVITVESNTDLIIVADAIKLYPEGAVTVLVASDYRADASEISQDQGTLASGQYKISDLTVIKSVVLTSENDVTVSCGGAVRAGKEITLTPDMLLFGLKLEGNASYVIKYLEGSQKNPIIITDERTEVKGGSYITVTAPADKDVILSLDSVSGGWYKDEFSFTYNDEKYGYKNVDGYYTPYDKLTLSIARGESVTVYIEINPTCEELVPVIVVEDLTAGAVKVELVKGAPADDKIVASATVSASGNYFFESAVGAIKVTGSSAFTIKVLGSDDIVATEVEGVYTATLDVTAKLYFSVELADGQSLSLSIEYAKGSEGYPEEITLNEGSATVPLQSRESRFIVLPAGLYKFTIDSEAQANAYFSAYVNGKMVTLNTPIEIKNGDKIRLICGYEYDCKAVISVTEEKPLVAYSGMAIINDGETQVIIRLNEEFTEGSLYIEYEGTYELTIEATETGYSFTYTDFMGENTGTIVVEGNTLHCTISWIDDPFDLTKQA